jgi:hypothetical protein
MHMRVSMIPSITNFILRQAHDDPNSESPTIGNTWATNFLKRYSDVQIRLSKPLSFDRAFAHDPNGIEKWYLKFGKICIQFNIHSHNIWNFDETGFLIRVRNTQKIVTRIQNKKVRHYHPDPKIRQYLSSVESVRSTE